MALLWGLALALTLAVAGLTLLTRALRARRKAERALRAMRNDFRAVIDNIQDVYYRTDKAGNLNLVSPSGARLLGYDTVEDMLGKPNASFWHTPEERSAFLERMRREGRVVDHEVTLRTRQGEPVVVATSSAFYANEAGEIQGVEGIFRDIRDRKRGDAAIIEAERRYRELFTNVPVAIFQASPDGRFLKVNPEYARIIGYPSPQAMQDGVQDIAAQLYVDPADRDRYKRLLARDGEIYGFETRLRRLDGQIFWATMNSRVKRDAAGNILYYEGFLMDITNAKEAEAASQRMHEHLERQVAQRTRELQASNERLRELDILKSQFLASASHELRTPLTSIMGFAKITARLFEKHFQQEFAGRHELASRGETILENLRILTVEGERLTRLVNDLLDLNTIESGALHWRDEDCDPALLLRDAARAVQGQIAQRQGLAFRLDIAPDLPRLRLDGDKFKQVVLNLLNNAVKFCDSGEIRLVARREDPHWLEIRLEDEGPGIPVKDLERIFEKFYQSLPGGPADHKPKGTGLGLTICRQIVEHYGGSITAQSTPGQGATFVVRLPIATVSPETTAS